MKTTSILTATTCALLIGALASRGCMAAATTAATGPTYRVDVSQRRLVPRGSYDWRHARTHALLTTEWYPAAAKAHEEPQWLGSSASRFARAGEAAPRAALAPMAKRFPLIVISHGAGGSALALAWFGTWLAAHGFIALARRTGLA
jgi:predicted dienelactone hydrolase